jgi:molybdopterin-synthase adenylyltransferase
MKSDFVSITSQDWGLVEASLFTPDGNENSGVLLCGSSETKRERRLLVRKVVPVPDDLYVDRNDYHLEVSPRFYNRIIDQCLREHLTPVIIHSHPHHRDAWYSASDDFGEKSLIPVLKSLIPGAQPASLVITPQSAMGRRLVDGKFLTLTGLKIYGQHSRIIHFDTSEPSEVSEVFDRQVRAFGSEGQQLLQSLKIAIVGGGGIGSLVLEQFSRIGVTDIVLIDDDRIEVSNLTRLVGATKSDIGKSKAEVLGRHAKRLGVKNVAAIKDSAIRQDVLMALRDRDLILSCVDNDRTRSLLNRFAYQYLIPVIEMGTRLDAREGRMRAAAGRVVLVGSGMACMRCSHHLDPERIRAESLPKNERAALEKEDYVMGVDEAVPAVISLNAVVAGLGVTAGLNLFLRLTGGVQPIGQIYDATSGSVFTTNDIHEPGCDICDESVGIKALGDSQIVSAYD